MSNRHTQGRLTNPEAPLAFRFNGQSFTGLTGDTLASALLANGQSLMGRSFKYHRPRGPVASGAEEPNALVALGEGPYMEPNQRATTTELYGGLSARSQNHWPSLEFDVGEINSHLSRFLPAGFYYKTFLAPRAAWKHLFEPIIRKSAGLGPAPKDRDPDRYEHFYAFADVVVVGGGIAGLQAALAAGQAGAKVLLLEQTAHWGGRAPVDGEEIAGKPADAWIEETVKTLEDLDNVTLRLRTQGSGVYDHGSILGYERLTDHIGPDSAKGMPRHRLWRIRAKRIITATGAIERPLSFAGNDLPNVMLAGAMRDYLVNFGVAVAKSPVIVTNNDDAYRTAITFAEAGLMPAAIVDVRSDPDGDLIHEARARGIRIELGKAISKVQGRKAVTGVYICPADGDGSDAIPLACDGVAMSGGWSPVVHLWSHCGGKLLWNAEAAHFAPDPTRPPTGHDGEGFVLTAGTASGALAAGDVLTDADKAGKDAARACGHTPRRLKAPKAKEVAEAPLQPTWIMPANATPELRAKAWLDFQNDVKVSDLQLAAREGYESVEHSKRYTTIGMATDQGKLSNINGIGVLSQALGEDIPQVGTTTFRPPYTPISLGAIAGEARGELFQPLRRTPMHDWHEAHGAKWEPVGAWRRPFTYLRERETVEDAVARETRNTRENVGLLDASTLGKILVKGPDAGKFLDLLYTNMMSTLAPGKCRYGLMCNENGFLMDDGVVARIDEDTFLCHTTTGGAEHIHGHMEEWLQTEWWDLQVYTANLTEQYAQIAVVGPKARKLLEKLGGMDVSRDELPFMQWRDGTLAGIDARVYRISFSGELSYEIAVAADQGQALWDKLLEAGQEFGVMPYGTEGLHILRAEKGFIMIGDETDGTVIPQDLNLNWALSKKKDDYLGKRAHLRKDMSRTDRWKLVGLHALDDSVLPDGAYILAKGENENGQRKMQGRITSTYHSPNLGHGIAMALIEGGMDRLGDTVEVGNLGGEPIEATVVDPVFYDKDGEKQNV
ncbi:sarcosine oxidase subunit alpha family protein [Halocynthiibacter sp. C4]|uniref:sarcosine oxidase subunit alpha family protein n=1 Tax=Halocynthiibacter sp. C4 TaxID=2992758 RepID=UPI00237BFCB6|nr:sarcosine oxidase subunit alpha family protein [Halocynthiibacter sp. C4]MDE0589947.1 sarcosine oxidase subunit alpha family protein [Halocynthiibacter sp. C4]